MKILIDLNLSPEWTLVFGKYGIESLPWSTVGDPRAIDRVIMNWARVNSYVVFTHDLDFGALLAATQADALACNSSAYSRRTACQYREFNCASVASIGVTN